MIDFDDGWTMTIGGAPARSTRTFPAFNPATKRVIAEVPDADRADLDRAVATARAAFPAWADEPVERRQSVVAAIGRRIEEHAASFMALLTKEQGKPRAGAEWEILGAAAWCREIAKQSLPEEVFEDGPECRVVTRFTPLGVVGAIVPWNFPLLLAVWKIAPALVTGNAIVVKPWNTVPSAAAP
jgi:acyl-CoA reductase-like NAD-dependent aldehyde dehydrogenase